MKSSFPILLILLVAAAGCSKKEPAAATTAEPAAAEAQPRAKAKAAADDGAFDPNVAATVATTPAKGKKGAAEGEGGKNWDAVVAEIVQIRRSPMTDEKRQRMLGLQDELGDAAKTDAAAREAYQNLSKLINGR